MEKNPLVSVICLCYNHENYLIESLNSVVHQHHTNIEIIIVDDCSSDGSREKIKSWLSQHPKVVFIVNEHNLGNTKSFNKALKIAKGDFIIDLATDDVLLPHCIEKQLEGFKNTNYKNIGIVYGNATLIDAKSNFIKYYFPVDVNEKIINKIPTGNIYAELLENKGLKNSVTALVKKEVFDQLNGYDETLAYEDFDLWTRASRSFDIEYLDVVLAQKRVLPNSLSAQFYTRFSSYSRKINASNYKVLQKAFHLNQNKREDKALAKRIQSEIITNCKNLNIQLVIKLLYLRLQLQLR
jgi:glycosyltransferase involved in cell wall biosynthesis